MNRKLLVISKNRGHFQDKYYIERLGRESYLWIYETDRVGVTQTTATLLTNMDLLDIKDKIDEIMEDK